jgi:hypothetical protein
MRTLLGAVVLTAVIGGIVSAVAERPAHAQQSVVVVSDQDNPVHVQEVRHPALRPYHGTATINFGGRGGPLLTNFEPAPQGGRLVIEYVSAACSTNLDTRILQLGITTTVDSLSVNHFVVPVLLHTTSGSRRYAVAQATRLYHDTNSTFKPFRVVSITAFGEQVLNCSFAVSGHTVIP